MERPINARHAGALLFTACLLAAHHAGAAIGRTPGAASISHDGEAGYTIPLAVPPGTNGMTPELSFEYRHRTQGGLLGVGWSIGGLSQIALCPRTIVQDGFASPVGLTSQDRFCLDGQRLVLASGITYGEDGAEYRTEIESFARIRSIGGGGIGPWHFVVEAADGRVFEYGATPNSRIDTKSTAQPTNHARVWALNRIRDRSGNIIDYTYTEDLSNASFRIASIRYNSNPEAGISASHRVAFTYEDRPNSEVDTAYIAGTPIRQVVRLDHVDVIYSGTVLRRYELEYEAALPASGRSRLASVQECAGPGTDCLTATTFDWQNGTPGFGSATSFAAAMPGLTPFPEIRRWTTADINGDGRSDYIWSGGDSTASVTIRYRLARPDGSFGPEINSGISSPYGIGVAFDRNGDGRDDFLMISATAGWVIVPGASAGLGTPIATGIAVPQFMRSFSAGDMNADGLGDIVWSETDSSYSTLLVRVRYALPAGGFAPTPIILYEQSDPAAADLPDGGKFIGPPGRRIDFNGDGADDLLVSENFSIAQITASKRATLRFDSGFYGGVPVDFNGDGCSDFAYKHYTNRLRIRLNGCGVGDSGTELEGPPWSGGARLLAIDWNGDGREDLLMSDGTTWHVAISSGDSFPAITNTGIAHGGADIALAADVNGDGLDDLVAYGAGRLHVRRQKGPKADLMLAATDGFGVGAEFSYSPLTDAAVYKRGSGAIYPEQDMQSAAYVVSRLTVTDGSGRGTKSATAYNYEGLRRHLLGRGSLGFAKQTRTDMTSTHPLNIEETRRQDFPYTGLPLSVVLRQPSGRPVTSSNYQWSVLNFSGMPRLRQFPYATKVTTRRYAVGGALDGAEIATIVRETASIDGTSGLVTDETTTVTEVAGGVNASASASLRTLHTGIVNDTANWCLGRPQGMQLTAAHTLPGGTAVTRSFSRTWDSAKCRPTLLSLEPGNTQWQLNYQITYDAFGNQASRRITGAGVAARITTIGWDSRGQFPVSIKNPLAQTTRATWDPGSGQLLEIADPNGLTTNWSYDAFGDLESETQPDGTRTTWTADACNSRCDQRTRSRLTQRELDKDGVIRVTSYRQMDQHGRAFRFTAQRPGGGLSISKLDANESGQVLRQYLPYWEGGAAPGYWEFAYDSLGRLTDASLVAAGGAIERSLALRPDGLAVTQTDALGHATTGTRTVWGSLSQVDDAAGNSTHYEYDAFGNLLRVRDALNNQVAAMTYNTRGMKLSQTDMDMGTWTWNHNALGEITSLRDAKLQVFEFAYDPLGRVTGREAPDGTSSWVWGNVPTQRNVGRLIGLSSPGYSETLSYDSSGRPAVRTIVTDASYRYDYAYNSLGLLDSMTYPSGGAGGRLKVRYQYDAGRLSGIVDAAAAGGVMWQLNAQDAAGNPVDESLGSAVRVITGFSPLTGAMDYRQSGSGGKSDAQDLSYVWDANDNLIRREDHSQNLVEEFRYDRLDRLEESRRNGALNLALAYDAIGNIRRKSDVCPDSTPCYTYHANRKHAVTSAGGKSYAYDANGNMTSRGGAAIAWASDNFPVSIAQAGGNRSQFWYGPAGNRWKQVATNAGTTETTIYAGESMEKVTRNGVTTWRHYVTAPTGTAALHLRYSNGSAPATRYLTHDYLGSTDKVLDPAGKTIIAESFDAFGQRRGPNWAATPASADLAKIAANTRDGFTGHEHLDNLGLIHMNGRVFDPRLGRFISADPYVTAPFDGQSLNHYSYVWNNPLGFVDPSGFDPACVETSTGNCAQITVIGITWADYIRYVGGAGVAQAASALERDPCGMEGSALACALHGGRLISPSSIVLTAGTKSDSTLSRSRVVDQLEGFAARLGNLAISSSPLAMLFGADPDFQWFDEPDNADGRAGAMFGNVGYFVGGAVGAVRKAGLQLAEAAPSQIARSFQGNTKYPGIDRFKDITLKKGTVLYSAYPGQTAFYTTASALRRSAKSAETLFQGLQAQRHRSRGYWSRVAAYEVISDTPAAFGLTIANLKYGAGWYPQVVVPSYETRLRLLEIIPLGP
jgi:RHS repeat-associated protein